MRISDFAIQRPVTTLMALTGVLVFGVYSYGKLPVSLLPEITYPTITIRTDYTGAAPEEVENLVSIPIEEALGVVASLVRMSSVSRAGQSEVVLEFAWGTNMDLTTMDVREKLDQVRFPDDVTAPLLYRMNPDLDPILRLGLYGNLDLLKLRKIADDEVKRKLDGTPGVAAVKIRGGLEEEIQVTLDHAKLETFHLTQEQVSNSVMQQNVNLSGGKLRDGDSEYLIRTLNEFESVREIGDVVVGYNAGRVVLLKDVAGITRIQKDRQVITRINGQECVEIAIYKEADANTVSIAQLVKQKLGLERKSTPEDAAPKKSAGGPGGGRRSRAPITTKTIVESLPPGVSLEVLTDSSRFIRNSLNEVLSSALTGGGLAVIVLYVFLRNLTSTLIVSVAIPFSVVATFLIMFVRGLSLNVMSLGGLALGIGMLVDNSIVVLEAIFRYKQEGDDNRTAASKGAAEVGTAVVASTLTTVAVFLPIAFVEGIAGQVFNDLALTVVFSLIASLVVALTVIPMISGLSWNPAQSAELFPAIPAIRERFAQHIGEPAGWRRFPARARRGVRMLPWAVRAIIARMGAWLTRNSRLWRGLSAAWADTGNETRTRVRRLMAMPRSALRRLVLLLIETVSLAGTWLPQMMSRRFPRLSAYRAVRTIWWVLAAVFVVPVLALFVALAIYQACITILSAVLSVVAVVLWEGLVFTINLLLMLAGGLTLGVLYLAAWPFLKLFEVVYGGLERLYPRLLRLALRQRLSVILGGLAAVFFGVTAGRSLGWELIPQMYQGQFNVTANLPVGSSLDQTDSKVRQVERETLAEIGASGGTVFSQVGTIEETSGGTTEERENRASITVTLKGATPVPSGVDDGAKRDQPAPGPASPAIAYGLTREPAEVSVMEHLRPRLDRLPGMTLEFSLPSLFSFKTPVEIEIQGYDLDTLKRVSGDVVRLLGEISALKDVQSNIEDGYPEIAIQFDREAVAAAGQTVSGLAAQIRDAIKGGVPTKYNEPEGKLDIRLWLREEDRVGLQSLRDLPINPASARPVTLGSVAELKAQSGPSEIRRIDQQRTAVVSANLAGLDLRTAIVSIEEKLDAYPLPQGITIIISGQQKEMSAAFNSLVGALLLAAFLVYLVMASQFESFMQPLIIILSVPLAAIGVTAALRLTGTPVSIVVFIGLIVLVGIVVNNAIVLIDYANQLRQEGRGLEDALVEAGSVRLRPILMTTATTVLGLLPMALGLGEGAELRRPMALVISGGLISSTLLTLIVIPVIYAVFDSLQSRPPEPQP